MSRSTDAALDALLPASRQPSPMTLAQTSGVFACDNADHNGERGGKTPGGLIDHAFSRKAALEKCNALDVLKVLVGRKVLTVAEVTARKQGTDGFPTLAVILARVK